MSELPDNLVPLPTMPFEERPDDLPLDVEECRTALWLCSGNVTQAAEKLKVNSGRLRRFVRGNAYLKRELDEATERLVDAAEDVAAQALRDPERQDAMARFILNSKGKARGWGTGGESKVNVNTTGPISITWADGSSVHVGSEPKHVESEVIDG